MKQKIHINLPPGFFETDELEPVWDRLEQLGSVTRSSCNQPAELAPHLPGKDAILMWAWPAIDEAMLAAAPELRIGAFLNVSPKTAALFLEKGLPVSEARHGWSPAVAELALGLALNGLRRISEHHLALRRGEEHWVSRIPADVDPRERQLTGRSVGIVGFGGVGRRLVELLAPFRTDLRIFDPYVPEEAMRAVSARKVSLGELLSESDVVILCAANTGETCHLLDAAALAALRRDAVLVNVARASLVDTGALVERLRKGDLIALSDVFDEEPLGKDSVLRELPNFYGTPHRAGGIRESAVRILTMLVDDLEAFFQGRPLRYELRPEAMRSIT